MGAYLNRTQTFGILHLTLETLAACCDLQVPDGRCLLGGGATYTYTCSFSTLGSRHSQAALLQLGL